jgi:cyclic beta-1,2-glucan synthetase
MAHHQGMALLAIDNALLGNRMQERFHHDPLVQSTEFLLEERMPVLVDVTPMPEAA